MFTPAVCVPVTDLCVSVNVAVIFLISSPIYLFSATMPELNFAARSNWTKTVAAFRSPPSSWHHQRAPWRGVRSHRKSAVAKMLSTRSASGKWWFRLQTVAVVVALGTHFATTVEGSVASHGHILDALEVGTSVVFTLDFMARLLTCHERNRFSHLSPMAARMQWAFTWEALLSAASCVPIFAEEASRGSVVASALQLLPVLLLFRTSRWREAVRTARRVLFLNREVLGTSLALVSLTILLSGTMLYVTCAHSARCSRDHGISDLPSATFVATLMLTGQASPEGTLEPPAFRAAVMLTAFLSVPFFAVPAAMLTWGFEGEAQRLAAHEQLRTRRQMAYGDRGAATTQALAGESSSDDDAYEELLETIGDDGADEGVREAAEERALAFFTEAAVVLPAPPTHPSAPDGAGGGAAPQQSTLLFRAQELARTLKESTASASRTRQHGRDALELLEKVSDEFEEGISSDQAEQLESRLQEFARAVGGVRSAAVARGAGGGGGGGGAARGATSERAGGPLEGGNSAAETGAPGTAGRDAAADAVARIDALQLELVALRRTTVAGLNEVKGLVAEALAASQSATSKSARSKWGK